MNRNFFLSVLATFAAAFFLPGCATTAGGIAIASGEQSAGDIYANSKLAKVDSSPAGTAAQQQAIADLTRVGSDLVAFSTGALSFYELGAIEEQLKKDGVALSSDTNALTQINSVLNILAQNVAGPTGLVTPIQSQIQGQIKNIVSGFSISIQTYEGRWGVTNPGAWPAPAPAAATPAAVQFLPKKTP